MARAKVWGLYFAYAVLFAAVFAVMLLMLTSAVIGMPTGLLMFFFGIAMQLFKADYIVTELTPTFMIFGGLSAAFTFTLIGLAAVKAGFLASRLFLRVKRRCDKLRGW